MTGEPITTDPRRYKIPSATDLRQLRLIAGLDVREVAERLGRCEDTICSWEAGRTEPGISETQRLLDIYHDSIAGQQQLVMATTREKSEEHA